MLPPPSTPATPASCRLLALVPWAPAATMSLASPHFPAGTTGLRDERGPPPSHAAPQGCAWVPTAQTGNWSQGGHMACWDHTPEEGHGRAPLRPGPWEAHGPPPLAAQPLSFNSWTRCERPPRAGNALDTAASAWPERACREQQWEGVSDRGAVSAQHRTRGSDRAAIGGGKGALEANTARTGRRGAGAAELGLK